MAPQGKDLRQRPAAKTCGEEIGCEEIGNKSSLKGRGVARLPIMLSLRSLNRRRVNLPLAAWIAQLLHICHIRDS